MTTDRHACGLTSFLPMSCRGRAEAFARRLQSRLQSLGRQPSADDPSDSEASWLTGSQQRYPTTNHQPAARLSSSSDSSDVYFDFDVYFGSPGSPLEEATDADDVHVNQPHSVATVGEAAASPGSDDSAYFDPEVFDFGKAPSLDADAQCCNGHDADPTAHCGSDTLEGEGVKAEGKPPASNDPQESSSAPNTDADVTDDAACAITHVCPRVRRPRVDYTKCNGVGHEHSAETHDVQVDTHEAHHSIESHEEAEVTKTQESETDMETHEFKVEAKIEHTTTETNDDDGRETEAYEVESRIPEAEIEESTKSQEAETSTTHEIAEAEPHELDTDTHDPVHTSVAVPPSLLSGVTTHGCSIVAVFDLEVTAAPHESPAPQQEARVASGASASGSHLEADDTDYEDRPQRVRRCSSLKTGKTPPGTPGRKKIVRFADVLGLDLADVRTFLDEVPKVPTSAYEDLADADLCASASLASLAAVMPKPDRTLVPMFVQPGGCADFFDRVREQQVCLENAVVSDVMLATIAGTVRVRNLDFNKSVHIRYSVDSWKSFSDLQASYVQNSCDGFSDTFSFVLYAHTVTVGQRLEFAVRFQCHGCQYWDSNRGGNYVFQCLPPAGQMSFRSHSMSTCPDEQWASFY